MYTPKQIETLEMFNTEDAKNPVMSKLIARRMTIEQYLEHEDKVKDMEAEMDDDSDCGSREEQAFERAQWLYEQRMVEDRF